MILKEFNVMPTITVDSLFGDNTETKIVTDTKLCTLHITLTDCSEDDRAQVYMMLRAATWPTVVCAHCGKEVAKTVGVLHHDVVGMHYDYYLCEDCEANA